MQPDRWSIQNPKSKIQNLAPIIALVFLCACGGPDWDADQQSVHKAMRDWSAAVTAKDANRMWEMMSPDAREAYKRELEGPVRTTVRLNKAALASAGQEGSLITPAQAAELEKELRRLPPDPDSMTAQEYYVWRTTPDLTAEGAERTASLYSKNNIEAIVIEGDRATVTLKHGDESSWVRHSGVWKFDLKPSTLLALEEARMREGKTQ